MLVSHFIVSIHLAYGIKKPILYPFIINWYNSIWSLHIPLWINGICNHMKRGIEFEPSLVYYIVDFLEKLQRGVSLMNYVPYLSHHATHTFIYFPKSRGIRICIPNQLHNWSCERNHISTLRPPIFIKKHISYLLGLS